METIENTFVKSVNVNVDKKTVTRKHVTESEKMGEVNCNWTFDFSKVSQSDLLELASRSVLISRRGTFKKLEKVDIQNDMDENDTHIMSIDVADYIDKNGRKPVDKMAVAKKAIGGMTDEQKLALLAILTGETDQEAE